MGLFLTMPAKTFNLGDTAECKINGQPTQVTWRDKAVLVLHRPGEPDDERIILDVAEDYNGLRSFACSNHVDDEDQEPMTVIRPG